MWYRLNTLRGRGSRYRPPLPPLVGFECRSRCGRWKMSSARSAPKKPQVRHSLPTRACDSPSCRSVTSRPVMKPTGTMPCCFVALSSRLRACSRAVSLSNLTWLKRPESVPGVALVVGSRRRPFESTQAKAALGTRARTFAAQLRHGVQLVADGPRTSPVSRFDSRAVDPETSRRVRRFRRAVYLFASTIIG